MGNLGHSLLNKAFTPAVIMCNCSERSGSNWITEGTLQKLKARISSRVGYHGNKHCVMVLKAAVEELAFSI